MKLKHLIFKILLKTYNVLPLKKQTALLLRHLNLNKHKIYKDLKFSGIFKIKIQNENLKIHHFGGKIENEIFWNGLFQTWESETGFFWLKICKEMDVIFDIGANTGIYSMVTKAINPSSKIHAFEPSKQTYFKLKLNNKINKFNINCQQLALSDKSGESIFYDSFDPNQTSASLSDEMHKLWGKDYNPYKYSVRTVTLDEYIRNNGIQKIDLIKIDVEMHEPQIIMGFKEFLNSYEPIIFIEVLSDKVAKELNLLFSDNYNKYHISLDKKLNLKKEFEVVPMQWNYLLIPKSKSNILADLEDFIIH